MPVKSNLQSVIVTTKQGSVYSFPDVDMAEFKLAFGAHNNLANLTLVNASGAALVLPMRIVKQVTVTDDSAYGEEILWTASTA
jgi:hypothetical protein